MQDNCLIAIAWPIPILYGPLLNIARPESVECGELVVLILLYHKVTMQKTDFDKYICASENPQFLS